MLGYCSPFGHCSFFSLRASSGFGACGPLALRALLVINPFVWGVVGFGICFLGGLGRLLEDLFWGLIELVSIGVCGWHCLRLLVRVRRD